VGREVSNYFVSIILTKIATRAEAGLQVESLQTTFYIWSTIPKGFTSQNFCLKVFDAADVWLIPGSIYGKYGEEYLRIVLPTRLAVWRAPWTG